MTTNLIEYVSTIEVSICTRLLEVIVINVWCQQFWITQFHFFCSMQVLNNNINTLQTQVEESPQEIAMLVFI